MKKVLAALDTSPAARPVLETALRVGQLVGASVEAVHVHDRTLETLETLTSRARVPLRVVSGPVERALLEAVEAPEVVAAVLGVRSTAGGRHPAGRTALAVLKKAPKPIVVVPPEAVGVSPGPLRRLLVPLEGTEASSLPIAELLQGLVVTGVELVVLHVWTSATAPRMLDRPVRDQLMLGREFLARYAPGKAASLETRTGSAGGRIIEVCAESDADLIVLSWSQDIEVGHAAVIREVLTRSEVPVLLLPVPSPRRAEDPSGLIDIRTSPAPASRARTT